MSPIVAIIIVLAVLLAALVIAFLLVGRGESRFKFDIGGSAPTAAGGSDMSTEGGFKTLLNAWKTGQPVEVVALERENADPYLTGSFVIASLEQSAPAQDDVTYSGTLENNGEVTLDPSKITGESLT